MRLPEGEGNIESLAKGRAIHRPTGWIRSYRSKVQGLAEGKMSVEEYVAFDVLMHIVGWEKNRPGYGQIERNITRLQVEWFTFWSRSTLIKYLKQLAAKDYIIDDGHTLTVKNFSKYQSKNGVEQPTPETPPTVEPSTLTVEPSTLTVEPSTLTVEPSTLNLVNIGTTSQSTDPKELIKKDKKPIKNNLTPISPDSLDRFERFWKAYPKKKSVGQAEITWKKIDPSEELLQRMLKNLEVAKKSHDWTKDGGKYIPNGSTWLNAKGWMDEYAGSSSSPPDPHMDAIAGFLRMRGITA